ncbi:MAG: DUF2071 domain-containing protein [Chloroflexi bacterium AL-W]|nr:DUF2071 domain-containing protein [Chloroflexi bacterium AL-N1]NOK67406.1 DUF2071 domain-containing protein [Chloroflexi bacterium AL-N10]NOK75102.1 DUF2071 domain-containing protein [Chloroflexi bacterium AL-N5]NOK81889.1 DUF2071 domain-containing protein [Chloroflexi bacterium AL-W]NOK89735.1 DUF2071 domain-containing protein [Chloroflexi bacterium AL-N15]
MKFLTAHWYDLIMINYAIPPDLVEKYLPRHCMVDVEGEETYASLVLFEFSNTKVAGIKWPGYTTFSEINLRLYVQRIDGDEVRRGVVFVQELVPKRLIALIAHTFYAEPYRYAPIKRAVNTLKTGRELAYHWSNAYHLHIHSSDNWYTPAQNSHEAFIINHYWGYTPIGNKTNEYAVNHPQWDVCDAAMLASGVDFEAMYGSTWSFLNHTIPTSTFVAKGSDVSVSSKRILR